MFPYKHVSLRPPFLTDNIKLNGIPTKIEPKMQACLILHFKFWEGTSLKSYDTATISFISCFTSVLISIDIIFYNFFRSVFNIFWKIFLSQVFLFYPTYLSWPKPAKCDISCCQFFLRYPLKHFFWKICWQNPAKASFLDQ